MKEETFVWWVVLLDKNKHSIRLLLHVLTAAVLKWSWNWDYIPFAILYEVWLLNTRVKD